MKKLFNFIFRFYGFIKDNVSKSIRLELVVTFAICLISAFIAGSWYNGHYKEQHMIAQIDYSNGIQELSSKLSEIKSELENLNTLNKNYINQKIDESLSKKDGTVKIYLADMDGNVICKSKSAYQKKLDIYSLVNKAEDFRKEYDKSIVIDTDNGILKKRVVLDKVQEYVEIDGLNISNRKLYLIIMGVPEQKTTYIRSNGSIFSVIEAIVVFIGLFYFMTIKKMGYIEIVSRGLVEISKNNLDYRIKIYGKDELAKLANNINFMASELKKRVEGERAAEKTKNDLITNVSHDLRTPLTSIKGYLGLVKDKKYKDEVQMGEFLDIAYAKSEKLEILINDLFEYTKLSNKVIEIHRKKIYIDELLEQLSEELHVICEENDVKLHKNFHGSRIYAYVDPDKIVRVFENLIMNAIRYSLKPGGINLELKDNGKCIMISVENRCDHIDESDLKKLFNRFFRVDKSRSEATGGSGLGLAIAKSIVELHDGKIWAESIEDRVIFYVELKKDIQS